MKYSPEFYKTYKLESLYSAKEIVPHVMDLVNPRSVVDVGCGIGTWLSEFKNYGVNDICGLDGDYIDKNLLLIRENDFIRTNLKTPICLNRQFDLAVSLEVAEHLAIDDAKNFVRYLTSLSPVVLFSAAIPYQGGDNHLNEQWPEFWVEQYQNFDYHVIDCLRDRFWNNQRVAYYYAQNSFLFIRRELLEDTIRYRELFARNRTNFAMVHPKKWDEVNNLGTWQAKRLVRELPTVISVIIKRLFLKVVMALR